MARRDQDEPPERAEIGSATAADAVGGGEPVGVPSAVQAVRSFVEVAGRSGAVGREILHLGAKIGRVLLGTSELAPSPRDRRFTDPAWSENPLFRRLVAGLPRRRGLARRSSTASTATSRTG
jgi:polyhydroxyalkanoate synthase